MAYSHELSWAAARSWARSSFIFYCRAAFICKLRFACCIFYDHPFSLTNCICIVCRSWWVCQKYLRDSSKKWNLSPFNRDNAGLIDDWWAAQLSWIQWLGEYVECVIPNYYSVCQSYVVSLCCRLIGAFVPLSFSRPVCIARQLDGELIRARITSSTKKCERG